MFKRESSISLERKVIQKDKYEIALLQAELMRAFGTHSQPTYVAHNSRFSSITILPSEYFDYTKQLAKSKVLEKKRHLSAVIKDPLPESVDKPLKARPDRLVVVENGQQPQLAMKFMNNRLYVEQLQCRDAAEEYFETEIPCSQKTPLMYLGKLASRQHDVDLRRFDLPASIIVRPLEVVYE